MEKPIEIDASPEKIWLIIKWDGTPEWAAPWTKVEWASREQSKVGSAVNINVELDIKTELDCETSEIIENEKVAFRSIGKNSTTGFHSFTPTNDRTETAIGATYKFTYSFLDTLIGKMLLTKLRRRALKQV